MTIETVLFIVSKLIGAFLRPDTWIIILLAVVVLALIKQRVRLALKVASMTLLALVTLAVLPLGDLVLQPIERSYPANPSLMRVDGIIVLGGGEDARASTFWDQIQLNEGGDRLAAGLALARQFPNAKLLFAGGSGALRDLAGVAISEASIAKRFFLDQGIDPNRLLLEGRSRNTAENARFSLTLAAPETGDAWVLVTSAFHMPRALRSFNTAGWKGITPYPVDYRTASFTDEIGWNLTGNLMVLSIAIREKIGQLAYRMTA